METKILTTSSGDIKIAAEIIKSGGIVAFPTETVYGLGANAFDPVAVRRIYEAKGRPGDNPVIVHIANADDIIRLTPKAPAAAAPLMESFWPGPLTLIVEKKPEVPYETTAGLDTVAVRAPASPAARALIAGSGCPIAAPSANLSGRPSPTRASHVIEDLYGKIDAIIAGGDCEVGIESTVLDITAIPPLILRPGIITPNDIEKAVGFPVEFDPALFAGIPERGGDCEGFRPRSPGMKYKHYAPKAEMTIFEGRPGRVRDEIERVRKINESRGARVGVIMFEEKAFREAAHDFFAKLRQLDGEGVDKILAGALSADDGVGFAVMNRMLKSAGYNVIKV